jgi:hypothetical protein
MASDNKALEAGRRIAMAIDGAEVSEVSLYTQQLDTAPYVYVGLRSAAQRTSTTDWPSNSSLGLDFAFSG